MSSDKQESRREIAERVVIKHVNPFTSVDMKALTVAIQAALKERDERAAKIAESVTGANTSEIVLGVGSTIARRIRNEDTNA